MDRWETGRARRREQVEDALRFERDRLRALEEQLVDVVTETVAPALDAAAFAGLSDEDAELVREALSLDGDWASLLDEEDAGYLGLLEQEEDAGEDDGSAEEEIERLTAEIEDGRRREAALVRFLEALATVSPPQP